jgi:hypothetical protein
LAGALLFDEKTCQSVAFFGFDCGMFDYLQIFFPQAIIQRTIVDFHAFLETGLAEKISICVHTTRVPIKEEDQRPFCMKRLRTLKSFHKFKTKIEKIKNL